MPVTENLAAGYLKHLQQRNYSKHTLNTYACLLNIYRRWLHAQNVEDVRQVSRQDLERFLGWLATGHQLVNAGSRANFVKVLRGFYGFLCAERRILTDPAKDLGYPSIPQRIHRDILTPDELGKLLGSSDKLTSLGVRDQAVLRLLGMCGLRISELTRLRCAHADLRRRELMVRRGKGRKDRVVFFDHGTRQVLENYLQNARPRLVRQETKLMVVGQKGHALGEISIRKIVTNHVRRAGIARHVTPHSLRRTFAVMLLKGGCNLKVIAELMGHQQLSTTAGYTQLDTTSLKQVYCRTHPLGGL